MAAPLPCRVPWPGMATHHVAHISSSAIFRPTFILVEELESIQHLGFTINRFAYTNMSKAHETAARAFDHGNATFYAIGNMTAVVQGGLM